MTYVTIKGLDSFIGHAKKRIKASGKTRISIIGFFDLTGSTKLKVTKGQREQQRPIYTMPYARKLSRSTMVHCERIR
jgi:hypothetical protein